MELRFKEDGGNLTVVALRNGTVLGLLLARMVDDVPVVVSDQLPEEAKRWAQGVVRLLNADAKQEDANSMRNELMATEASDEDFYF